MSYDCRAVANAILDHGDALGIRLTHMAVHKVMYYAHGWRLAEHGCPLIQQEFEAWKDGPVQRLVYNCLKLAGAKPVTMRATHFDLVTRQTSTLSCDFKGGEEAFLRQIVAGYGHLHAFELSTMTHERGGPWDQVWNAPNGRVCMGMTIEHDAIRRHFLQSGMARRTA
jgi:uncharacterized phage-associated protein